VEFAQKKILVVRPAIRDVHRRVAAFIDPLAHQPGPRLEAIVRRLVKIVGVTFSTAEWDVSHFVTDTVRLSAGGFCLWH
jgi:hypothetical protein